MSYLKSILTIAVIFFGYFIYTQPKIKFKRYTTDNGLPANYALDVMQDPMGFMWFGMRGACCRFDGYTFKTYDIPIPDGKKKAKAWVTKIITDAKGRLWAKEPSADGLLLFDYEKDQFINCYNRLNSSGKDFKLTQNSISTDAYGELLLGTENHGTLRYNYDEDRVTILANYNSNTDSLLKGRNSHIFTQRDGTIWINVYSYLAKYSPRDSTCYYFELDSKKPGGIPSPVYTIIEDSENVIWLGLYKQGLLRFNSALNYFEPYPFKSDKENNFEQCTVYSIFEDRQKKFWIGTNNGVWLTDSKKHTIKNYCFDDIDPESINSNLVRKVYGDRSGNIWFCTSEGISKLKHEKFTSFSFSSRKNSISHNKVQKILVDKNNNILFALPSGIDILNTKTNKFSIWATITNDNKGLTNSPIAIEKDRDIGIWIGTFRGGLNYYSYSTRKFRHFNVNQNHPDSLRDVNIFAILTDSKNRLWIGTGNSGVELYDKVNDKFTSIKQKRNAPSSLPANSIRSLYEDSKQNIWVGTINGPCMFEDVLYQKCKTFDDTASVLGMKNLIVWDFLDTKNGKYIWMATNSGLICLDTETDKQMLFSEEEGLLSGDALAILEDGNHSIWISSSNGLYSFQPNYSNKDSSLNFRMYSNKDGLQGNEFLAASKCKLKDGTMVFGGLKGFIMFHPDSIEDNNIPPELVITEFRIANEAVKAGQTINGQVILNKSILTTRDIFLNPVNNKFSIEFAALHYTFPSGNKYSYKLEGYDAQWQYTGANHRKAEYMNLDGGEYIFRLTASNSDGIWNNKGISLHITVFPPWWKTWWFRGLGLMLLIGSMVSIYRLRLSALKMQKNKLEKIVFERTTELREANSQLEEKQEEILQQNEEILTVNHELKQKNEEINAQKDEIEIQKDEIEIQKEELELSKNQLERALSNMQVLSELGQRLTATFNLDHIHKMIYNYVSSLMDTSAFGIGLYNQKRDIIDFPYFMEERKVVAPFFKSLKNINSLSVYCFKNKEEVLINDLSIEYKKYLHEIPDTQTTKLPQSMIHMPLILKGKAIGTLTVNSYKKNAYAQSDLANLRTLASYISIALDNSKAYRTVNKQKELITGSITYGKTIQQAMLPPQSQLDTFFDSFVIYKPKNIVSGDFYLFVPLNPEGLDRDKLRNLQGLHNYYFLAVVDCTGHGVPGAFMSMIGTRLLLDIINEHKIYSPAKILERLNHLVRSSLHQDTSDNMDGMDLGLCKIENINGEYIITYGGAKNPLIYYNCYEDEFHIVSGTLKSIGGITSTRKMVDFTEIKFSAQKGDVLVLYTDGFIDQCNNKKIKFAKKRLIETLKQNIHLPMKKQGENLLHALEEFQGDAEQRDDMTVLGIQL